MSHATHVRLDKPCHADPGGFVALAGSRFCGSCQRAVHDFTHYTDAELIAALRAQPTGCGSFRADQLDRALIEGELGRRGWSLAAISVLLALQLFSADYLAAQTPAAPVAVEQVATHGQLGAPFGKTEVTVFDELGEPLYGANLRVLDREGKLLGGASTDTAGRAMMVLPEGAYEIQASYIGLQTASLGVTESRAIRLESVLNTLSDVVIKARGSASSETISGAYSEIRETRCFFQAGEAAAAAGDETPAGEFTKLSIYPNPSTGQTTVPLHRPGRRAQLVNVYTAHGQLLRSDAVGAEQESVEVALPGCAPAGSYIVEVLYADGVSAAYPWQVTR